jgi:hypothetical protein
MRSPIRLTLALPLAAALLVGCSKSGVPLAPSGSNAGDDQTQVLQEVAIQPDYVEDGVYESEGTVSLGSPAPAGATAAIHPLTFWRVIRSVDRSYHVDFADPDASGRPTTAVVTIHKQLHGTFNILTGDVPEDSARTVVRKPLDDQWVRKVLLKRLPRVTDAAAASAEADGRHHSRWRLAATTGVQITSKEAATQIQSLRIQTATFDTTITDPLQFFRLRAILRLDPQGEVTLTVTTLRNDDVVVLHHRDHRFRFHNNGDNTYTGVWPIGAVAGVRHFGVNALSNATLFDDALPYDSQSWILPYVVRPTQLAEYAE